MHNPGYYSQSTHNIFDNSINLNTRPFTEKLYKTSCDQCVEFLGVGIKDNISDYSFCRRELMIASSCVLLSKANSAMGDLKDNVGLCKYEIELTQNNLKSKFPDFDNHKMNNWLRNLNFSITSFV